MEYHKEKPENISIGMKIKHENLYDTTEEILKR